MSTRSVSYKIHPARICLQLHGVSVSEVARDVGISTSAVSQQLAGRTRLSEDVYESIADMVGYDCAEEIVAEIPKKEKGESND